MDINSIGGNGSKPLYNKDANYVIAIKTNDPEIIARGAAPEEIVTCDGFILIRCDNEKDRSGITTSIHGSLPMMGAMVALLLNNDEAFECAKLLTTLPKELTKQLFN